MYVCKLRVKHEHHAQHVLGDHVGVQPAHVGQHDRMLDQLGKHIVFQAGGGRLHPAQPRAGGQQRRA